MDAAFSLEEEVEIAQRDARDAKAKFTKTQEAYDTLLLRATKNSAASSSIWAKFAACTALRLWMRARSRKRKKPPLLQPDGSQTRLQNERRSKVFEITRESDMDRALTAIEKAVYRIRHCAEHASDVEEALNEINEATGNPEIALVLEMNR